MLHNGDYYFSSTLITRRLIKFGIITNYTGVSWTCLMEGCSESDMAQHVAFALPSTWWITNNGHRMVVNGQTRWTSGDQQIAISKDQEAGGQHKFYLRGIWFNGNQSAKMPLALYLLFDFLALPNEDGGLRRKHDGIYAQCLPTKHGRLNSGFFFTHNFSDASAIPTAWLILM